MHGKIKLLDCTLRDGGYITDWNWGFKKASDIINSLVKSNIDIIEVGFLRNVSTYDENILTCNKISELNRLLPSVKENVMFAAMAMQSDYDINQLDEYSGSGIEMIRITAHDYDIEAGLNFAYEVKRRGYKLSINPINIMGYSDNRILWIIEQVNDIQPYQFSIVDTFGSMKRRDLDRIVSLVDNNLAPNIRLGLHLHENMAQSFNLAQNFIDKHISRSYTIDGSLMGIGRVPGNLPIELIADYMNEYCDKHYDIDYLMDAIQDYIFELKDKTAWGYTPAYFLSAKHNLHRNYAEYYLSKGDLTIRDINHLLARVTSDKSTAFDVQYANKLYDDYMNNDINDTNDRKQLGQLFFQKKILIIAPGASIIKYRKIIADYIKCNLPIVISLNFVPSEYSVDYAFFSNSKRYNKIGTYSCKIIATSNLIECVPDFYINYNSLTGAFKEGNNSLFLLIKLLSQLNVKEIILSGADGFKKQGENYYIPTIINNEVRDEKFNYAVGNALKKVDMNISFLTPSEYQKYYNET